MKGHKTVEGLTLIELLVVIAIIAIHAPIAPLLHTWRLGGAPLTRSI